MTTGIGRATLPQEFFDITSAQLLMQPEPQYLHAKLIKGALNSELDAGGPVGLAIPGRPYGDSGAAYANLEAGRLMLSDPIYGSAVKVVVELGKDQVGHTVRINRPVYANTTYTQASRRVAVGATISTTPITVSSEQVSITLERFAGPYDQTNSRVAPYAIERFDANKAIHSMAAVKEAHLKRDFDRTIDAFGVLLFDAAATNVFPEGMTANNDSVVAGDFPMDYATLRSAQTTLQEANIPPFANGNYMAILTPQQCEQLDRDPEYQRLARYSDALNPLMKTSYVKTVSNVDVFRSNTLTQTANSSSIAIHHAQMFGPGMVGVGAGGPPRVATSTDDMYGEQSKVIWLWYAGLVVLDNRFGVSIRTS